LNSSQRAEFYTVIASTAELFNRTLTDAAIELWWSALSDLSLEALKQGISKHLRDPQRGKFMPTPADVRHFNGARQASAIVAWGEVLDAIVQYGPYSSVLFQDGVINAVIRDLGGWPAVCDREANDENPIWLQKEFERRYEDYRAVCRVVNQPQVGLHERNNRNAGYLEFVGEPVYLPSSQQIEPRLIALEPKKQIESAHGGDSCKQEIAEIIDRSKAAMNFG
jgi:hypothetical protein